MAHDLLQRTAAAIQRTLADPDDLHRLRVYADHAPNGEPYAMIALPPEGPGAPEPTFLLRLTDFESRCAEVSPDGFDALQALCTELRVDQAQLDEMFPSSGKSPTADLAEQLVEECLGPIREELLTATRHALERGISAQALRRSLAAHRKHLQEGPPKQVLKPTKDRKTKRPRKKR